MAAALTKRLCLFELTHVAVIRSDFATDQLSLFYARQSGYHVQ